MSPNQLRSPSLSPHTSWVLAITSKFTLRKRWGTLLPEAMIYARVKAITTVPQPFTKHLYHPGRSAAVGLQRTMAQEQSGPRLSAWSVASLSGTRPARSRGGSGSAHSLRHQHGPSALMTAPAAMTVFVNNCIRREETSEPETGTTTIVRHVREKHRRVEEHFVHGRDLRLSRSQPELAAPDVGVAVERAPQDRQPSAMPHIESELQGTRVRAQPAIDAVRITDEVLKHLDRRLVAARERMGRSKPE